MSIQLRRRHNLKKLDQSVNSFMRHIHRCMYYSFTEFLDKISAGLAMNYLDHLGIKEKIQTDVNILFTLIRVVYYDEMKKKYDALCGM